MTERQFELLRLIEEAFRGVVLGDGVSLHETVVLDNYGTSEQRRVAREPDEKQDWRKLVRDPELIETRGVGGLSFFDAAGFRFHLPAYLTLAVAGHEYHSWGVNDIVSELEFHLTHFPEERFTILNASQRACVREVLIYRCGMRIREPDDKPGIRELDQAIAGFWSR